MVTKRGLNWCTGCCDTDSCSCTQTRNNWFWSSSSNIRAQIAPCSPPMFQRLDTSLGSALTLWGLAVGGLSFVRGQAGPGLRLHVHAVHVLRKNPKSHQELQHDGNIKLPAPLLIFIIKTKTKLIKTRNLSCWMEGWMDKNKVVNAVQKYFIKRRTFEGKKGLK